MSDTSAAARAVARRGLRLGSAHAARGATSMRMPESARLSAQATVRRATSDTDGLALPWTAGGDDE